MSDLLAWIDIETNGREIKNNGTPLEIALVITNTDLEILYEYTSLVRESYAEPRGMPSVVYDMHEASGLIAAMREVIETGWPLPRLEDVDYAIADKLYETKYAYDCEIILAGSGVSHFDSRWLVKFFPKTWTELKGYDSETKPTIDIGVVRRFIQTFKGEELNLPQGNHRALEDCKAFIAQAEILLSYVSKI